MKQCFNHMIFVLVMVFVLGGFTSAIAAEEEDDDLIPCQELENRLSLGIENNEYDVAYAVSGCCAHALRLINKEYLSALVNSFLQHTDGEADLIKEAKAQCGSSSETVRILENAAR